MSQQKLFGNIAVLLIVATVLAQGPPPLLRPDVLSAVSVELSGERAKRSVERLSLDHRQRGSKGYHDAAEFIKSQLLSYGLSNAVIEAFPADGKTMYGTQKSRMAWDAEAAELWEVVEKDTKKTAKYRVCDFASEPVALAEDSESADVTANLVDVGAGLAEQDYAGKQISGNIVLTSSQPALAERLAVDRHGARGIVSFAVNQSPAWRAEDTNLVRWGHLESFSRTSTFAFMISPKEGAALRDRLLSGESIRVHATVRAERHPGAYEIVTAFIPGADAQLKSDEIVFSCHLDHQQPGANDNASGCATILEIARALEKLIADGSIPRPARTIRFVWPPEIEGTLALLTEKKDLAAHIRAVIHMDMVGGGPETKAILHVTRAPLSLPSFVNDVGEAFTEFVNRETESWVATGEATYPLLASGGGKEALLAQIAEFTSGSDHEVYEDGSYRIPAIYLNDWPDRYIHTNLDLAQNIDSTKLRRSALIAAASGYFLASSRIADISKIYEVVEQGILRRGAIALRRKAELNEAGERNEAANLIRFELQYDAHLIKSVPNFFGQVGGTQESTSFVNALTHLLGEQPSSTPAPAQGRAIFIRNPIPRGPMNPGFGYNYLSDHYGKEKTRALRMFQSGAAAGFRHASGDDYAYETLNFVDGRRTAQEIRDAVSAEFGPISLDVITQYLQALESIGVLRQVL